MGIAVVADKIAFAHAHKAHKLPLRKPGFAFDYFQRIRVLLLRHDGAAGTEAI